MIEVRKDHSSDARRHALSAICGVAVFALLFVGLIVGLDTFGPARNVPGRSPSNSAVSQESSNNPGSKTYTDAELSVPVRPFHILLIGSDSRKNTALYTGKASEHAQVDQHADVITLVRVDPRTYTITLVTIPRDTVLEEGGSKINDSLLGNNPRQVVDAVAELTGVRSEFYMMITFTAFEDMVDAFGGITVDVPKKITVSDPASGDNVTVDAGENKKLNGAQALVLSRARKEYETDQDALRQVNVRAVEKALIDKALGYPREIDMRKMASVVLSGMDSNMTLPQAVSLLRDFTRHAGDITVYECTGPYEGDTRESDDMWVIKRDAETWAKIMELVEAGEDPSQVVVAPSF